MTETVFISGAGRGLGLSLTARFLQAGFKVFAGARSTSSNLDELLQKFPETLTVIRLDVAEMDSICQATHSVAENVSALDILINNAAINPQHGRATLDELDLSDLHLEQTMSVNVFGPLRLTQQFHSLLTRGQRKLILNISSEAGSIADCGRDREFAYCMSKAALNMQTKLLHNALSPQGFSVLSIHPGWVRTDLGGPQARISADESAESIFQLALKEPGIESAIYLDYQGNALKW